MGPIDYTIDVASPFQSVLQGYQAGSAVRNDQAQLQQQQAALEQQKQQKDVLQRLISNPNPTAADYANATLLVPGMKEQFKQAWDLRNSEQQSSDLQHVGQIYSAVVSGNPQVASRLLRDRAEAMRNSNDEAGAKSAEAMAGVIDEHPQFARSLIGMQLSAMPGGDKLIGNVAALNTDQRAQDQAPASLAKAEGEAAKAGADAITAQVAARYADQSAMMDLQKKGWDIKKVAADIDIAKEANRIAAMNAATSREGNALKREELRLKVQEARTALDEKIRAKVADAEASATSIDNSLNTIERIKGNKSLDSVLGSIEGRLPAVMGDDAADAIALIDTLGSQAFLSQAANLKGMGALSNAEGEKLQSALANLSRTQSEKQFRANLDEASRLLQKGRETLSKRSGVPLGKPDTPAAPGSRPPLSSFGSATGGASGGY